VLGCGEREVLRGGGGGGASEGRASIRCRFAAPSRRDSDRAVTDAATGSERKVSGRRLGGDAREGQAP